MSQNSIAAECPLSATTLLLLPGLDGTGELFEPFLATAPRGLATIPMAYPTQLATHDELEQWAMDKLVDNSVILAESFSGPLGVRLASDPRVRALMLCNSFVSPPRSPLLRHLAMGPLFSLRPPSWLLRWLLLGNDITPGLVKKVQNAIQQVPGHVLAQRLRQVLSCDERGTLSGLAKPVLYLRGINDRLVRSRSWQEMATLRPDATIGEIAGPHMLIQVHPKACWEAVLPLLSRHRLD